jgi:hypothetical protein
LAAGCAAASPSLARLHAEPVLQPLPGTSLLTTVEVAPRRGRAGSEGRDGVVEQVLAARAAPGDLATALQQRDGPRYGFRRVDLGVGTPRTVELRGRSAAGAEVHVVVSDAPPVPLYGSLADVPTAPAGLTTSLVVDVISRQ